ncbi:MAG: oligosaccharyl transferase, archaeosortase A system-associated [Halobacteria archaeon]
MAAQKPASRKAPSTSPAPWTRALLPSLVCGAILMGLVAFSIYTRAVVPWPSELYPDGRCCKFAADDAVMQMRHVELAVRHFPVRAFFDPFTFFPYGHGIHYGPAWTLSIAAVSLLVGGGNPSPQTVDTVAALFPAVMGGLTLIPVYLIGRYAFDRRTGLLAAAIFATIPGQFLSRSLLGFTDHHVAEVFYMAIAVALYIKALDVGRNLTFGHVLRREWGALRAVLLPVLGVGVAYGLYYLNWPGATMLMVPMGLFLLLQVVVEFMRGGNPDGPVLVTAGSLLTAILVMLPGVQWDLVPDPKTYTPFGPGFLGAFLALALVLGLVVVLFRRKSLPRFLFPFLLLALPAIGLPILSVVAPNLYGGVTSALAIFTPPTGGASTVAEASGPQWAQFVGMQGGIFHVMFFYSGFLLLVGYRILYRGFLKKGEDAGYKPGLLFLAIWAYFLIHITWAQNRFSYYSVASTGIVGAYFIVELADAAGLRRLRERIPREVARPSDLSGFLSRSASPVVMSAMVPALLFLAVFVGDAAQGTGNTVEWTLAASRGGPGSGGDYLEWLESLTWMRENTPDPQGPGLNFSAIYPRPPDGIFHYPKKSNGTTWYDYQSAYGVMSWWDYGHVITYFGKRIPNANPFQAGIGILPCPERDPAECSPGGPDAASPDLVLGAAPFLSTDNESMANQIADALGTRYVMSDWPQATGKFGAVLTWATGGNGTWLTEKYFLTCVQNTNGIQDCGARDRIFARYRQNLASDCADNVPPPPGLCITFSNPIGSTNHARTIESRLHFLDGSEAAYEWLSDTGASGERSTRVVIPALRHYRLVHESRGILAHRCVAGDGRTLLGQLSPWGMPLVNEARSCANGTSPVGLHFVVTFEYVRGAQVTGTTAPGAEVRASLPLLTNTGRAFAYVQSATAGPDGTYSLTLPYATEPPDPDAPAKGKTRYAVVATGPYTVTALGQPRELRLTDDEVTFGAAKSLDLATSRPPPPAPEAANVLTLP